MVSKNQAKFIKSLKIKKYRLQEGCFLIEGKKNLIELIKSDFEIVYVVATEAFLASHASHLAKVPIEKTLSASEKELASLGTFQSNHDCLAVAKMKTNHLLDLANTPHLFVLDGIGDPGNLGTIIRTLDWFGFEKMLCSHDCADFYNPKVINATMGSFARVKLYYSDISEYLKTLKSSSLLIADMDGIDISQINKDERCVIVMGSESHGVSTAVRALQHQKVTIPGHGDTESLNVAMATGIIAYELSRVV